MVGQSAGLVVGFEPENLVLTGIGSGTSVADVLVPLLVGIVIAGGYTIVLEQLGYLVARTTGVGSGYLRRIAATEARGLDATELRRKYDGKLENFAASFTESWFYAIDLVIAYRIFWGSAWCWPSNWDTSNGIYSDGRTSTIPNVPPYYAPREMRAFYVIEFGFYSSQLLSVLTKSKKKDFAQMVIHHMLTALLIALSYTIGALRVGIVVMVCHSMFDPFLNSAKCYHYMFRKTSPLHVLADLNFALCAITFFIFRFGFYPYAIYCTVSHQLPEKMWVSNATNTENVLKLMLVLLLPIHAYWFYLILKVLRGALGGGTVQGDARSDADDDSDSDDDTVEDKKER